MRLWGAFMMRASRFILLAFAAACLLAAPSQAKEYLLTGAKPDRLFLIDMEARKVVREYHIPDNSISPMTMVVSPDQKTIYVVTNHNKAITGISLESGEEVFRAELSRADDERAINYAIEISPDGRELYSYEVLTRLLPDRYEVQNPRISVYPTDGGKEAKASRSFNDVPRRIHMLLAKKDGSKLYALGWDFYTLNPRTGKIVDTYPLRHWKRRNASQPDLLNFWPMQDQTDIFMSPINWTRTDVPPTDPTSPVTGLLTLDIKRGKFDVTAIDTPPEVLFTATLSPNRKEAFAVYGHLLKIDLEQKKTVLRVPLDHSYYMAQVSGDGKEVYVGGTLCDIAIYAASDLKKLGSVELPGCPSMAGAPLKFVHW
jgi:quinohemoprotein amine dehydrogenase beta subunit